MAGRLSTSSGAKMGTSFPKSVSSPAKRLSRSLKMMMLLVMVFSPLFSLKPCDLQIQRDQRASFPGVTCVFQRNVCVREVCASGEQRDCLCVSESKVTKVPFPPISFIQQEWGEEGGRGGGWGGGVGVYLPKSQQPPAPLMTHTHTGKHTHKDCTY